MAQSVTLSSVGTASMVLNPVAKSTTFQLTVSSNAVGTTQIDVSLDDPTILGGPATTWSLLSSAAAMTSSTIFGVGLIYTVLSPVGMARINSSTITNTVTLKALQSITA